MPPHHVCVLLVRVRVKMIVLEVAEVIRAAVVSHMMKNIWVFLSGDTFCVHKRQGEPKGKWSTWVSVLEAGQHAVSKLDGAWAQPNRAASMPADTWSCLMLFIKWNVWHSNADTIQQKAQTLLWAQLRFGSTLTCPVLRIMSHGLKYRKHCGVITAPLFRCDYLYRNSLCGERTADPNGEIIILSY